MPTLIVKRGETRKWKFNIKQADGTAQVITGQTRTRFALSKQSIDNPNTQLLISRDTDIDGVTLINVDEANAFVEIFPTAAESIALPITIRNKKTIADPLVADIWITLSARDNPSETFDFHVKEGVVI